MYKKWNIYNNEINILISLNNEKNWIYYLIIIKLSYYIYIILLNINNIIKY